MVEHTPKPINEFGGLFGRDRFNDSVPSDHFIDSLNTSTRGQDIGTRDGFTKSVTLANVRRFRIYKREGEASRLLILDGSGNLYDATASLVTPILTIVGMTDFSILTQYNRCYITPHNGVKGLSGEFVYVYQGTGTARKAAGAKPVGGFNVAISATAGSIESGTHLFAWCYETDTGFITPPGTAQVLEFDGTKSADFTNVPTGPSGTAARRLIASRAIQDYNGDTEGYEMFFVSGGRIANNTATTLSAVDFFDADLQISADYTYDQLEEISAGCFLAKYDNRLCVGGTNSNPSLVYISKNTEPESINSLAGFVVCDPAETEGVKNAVEFRETLYITKANPGHTYATMDNGYDPSTWKCPRIDSSIGSDVNSLAAYMDQVGASAQYFIVGSIAGLYLFNGLYPDIPLSWKVDNWWTRINKAAFNTVQVVIDPNEKLIYVAVPLDAATTPNYILVGDFDVGLDPYKIAWHIWQLKSGLSLSSIGVDINSTTKKSVLRVSGYDGHVYTQVANQYNDDSEAYESYVKFSLLYEIPNWVHHFAGIGLRVKGDGTLLLTGNDQDDANSYTFPSLTLASSPGREYRLPINVNTEKLSLKLRIATINKYWILREVILYLKPIWATRPY